MGETGRGGAKRRHARAGFEVSARCFPLYFALKRAPQTTPLRLRYRRTPPQVQAHTIFASSSPPILAHLLNFLGDSRTSTKPKNLQIDVKCAEARALSSS